MAILSLLLTVPPCLTLLFFIPLLLFLNGIPIFFLLEVYPLRLLIPTSPTYLMPTWATPLSTSTLALAGLLISHYR